MAFDRVKIFVCLLCATILVGVSAYAKGIDSSNISARIGIFNSQKKAQVFFENIPVDLKQHIRRDQLWVNTYQTSSGLIERHLEISDLTSAQSKRLCSYVAKQEVQCFILAKSQLPVSSFSTEKVRSGVKKEKNYMGPESNLPRMLQPLGLRLEPSTGEELQGLDVAYNQIYSMEGYVDQDDISSYGAQFSLQPGTLDTPEAKAAKAAYDVARNNFLTALQNIGTGVNEGVGAEAARENLMALGREAFEAAGSAYLSGFLERNTRKAEILSSNSNSGEVFIDHVTENLEESAFSTVEGLVSGVLSSAADGGLDDGLIRKQADSFMLSGVRGVIDAGLATARVSDLYALRHMEIEYNLNNFEDSYLSVLTTQPIYQSPDLRHNVFLQGGGIINEKSVDINDDVSRHTLNIGGAYRYLTVDEQYLLGANMFFDHQWPYNHSRISIGVDAKAKDLSLAANYYRPLSDYRDSRTAANGDKYEERALEGYDVEVGYTTPFLPALSIFGKGYQYFRETDDDIRGMELSAEYKVRDNFLLKGAIVEENGGRDGVELALQYSVPLYDPEEPNLVLADIEPSAGKEFASMRSKIFEKVRRENRIRVEERLKVDPNAANITAQFNGMSIGLPFDVGGVFTGAGIDLPYDTAITIPNGDFGIITFSNGAIANLSASGGGDVIVEFNNTTLTVTATNGGFVQFISASGGITNINVPGGMVNLLGTDIDITDNGVTTTIQVRAGMIEVVPDVGVAVINGNQADVVSLTIASGATSLLVDPALETRQEAAYTNLDLINPDPPATETSAPFINVAPALITGPQFVGNNADLQLTFTQPVTVAGAPFINGLIDATPRTFAYNAGASTPSQPVFRHVYLAGDVGSAAITIQDLDLNGGTIIGTSNTLNAVTAYTDTVVAITDLTAPSLTGSTPVDNEPAFNGGSNIVLNFDENVQTGLGNITLTDTTDGSSTTVIPIGDAQVTIAGMNVTINPTGVLDLSTDYDLTIPSGVIEDTSGNDFAGIASGELNFTTSNDVTPPMLTGTTPNDNDVEVPRNANIVLTFDDNAIVGSGNITIHRTADDVILETIAVGSANVTGGGTLTITIDPTTDLPAATEVYVLIPGTAFEDAVGNSFAGITGTTDLSFRTFSPLDLTNLTLWLDGDDLDGDGSPEGVAEGGITAGDITTWTDKSGANNHGTTGAGTRPAFANPGANFVGTTNSASSGEFITLSNGGASGQTVITVLEGVTQNVSGSVNAFLDSAGTDYSFLRVAAVDYKISLDGAIGRQGNVAFDGGAVIGPGGNIAPPGPFPTDALLFVEYATVPTDHEIIGGLSTGGGAVPVSPSFRSNFIMREMIMYSDTKTRDLAGVDEREKIEGYLAHKYGITARLPGGHPFKTVAP